jgi:predicted Zn-dependent peptidase
VNRLSEVVGFFNGDLTIPRAEINVDQIFSSEADYGVDFVEVRGQQHGKRCLEVAAAGDGLDETFRGMGARVSWGDNPYIPMDDYLLNPSFSFIRLEAPLSSFEEAAELLIGHITTARLTGERVGKAVAGLSRERMIRSNSPLFDLRNSFRREIFGEHPYGNPIFPGRGSEAGTASLISFRESYFSGSRIVATLVSGMKDRDASGVLKKLFGELPAGKKAGCPPFPESGRSGSRSVPGSAEGAYILAGLANSFSSGGEAAAAAVAAEVMDRRIKHQIRVKRGLAYSTGCGFVLMEGGFMVQMHLGTRPENLAEASRALMDEITGLGSEKPDRDEIAIAVNRICSGRSRRDLSSINQAYSAGLDLLLLPGEEFVNLVIDTDPEKVWGVIESSFSPDNILYYEMIPGVEDGVNNRGVKEKD